VKVLTGRVSLISGSYGSKRIEVLALSLQMQGAAVSFRVQHLNVRRARSRLTSPSGNQHDPVLGLSHPEPPRGRGTPTRSLSLLPMLNVHFPSLADPKVF